MHKGPLTQADISILNEKIVTVLRLTNLLNNIVIVQWNKIRHLINHFWIERFTCSISYNIVISKERKKKLLTKRFKLRLR